jgi:hypothetical protein
VIAVMSQLLVDTVLMTTRDDAAIRLQIADSMLESALYVVRDTLARVESMPEQLQ